MILTLHHHRYHFSCSFRDKFSYFINASMYFTSSSRTLTSNMFYLLNTSPQINYPSFIPYSFQSLPIPIHICLLSALLSPPFSPPIHNQYDHLAAALVFSNSIYPIHSLLVFIPDVFPALPVRAGGRLLTPCELVRIRLCRE